MPVLYIVTGSSGSGKSSICALFKNKYPKFLAYDFDSVGVPDNPTIRWRKHTSMFWLNIAKMNAQNDLNTVLFGLVIPQEIIELRPDFEIKWVLLDINYYERKKRLQARQASQELIEDTEELVELRKWFVSHNQPIIDVSTKSMEEVLEQLCEEIIHK